VKSACGEFLSAAVVLSVPLGIAFSFPFGAFGFRAAEDVRRPVRTAFVTLTPETERQALRTVRTTWRGKTGAARQMQSDLLAAELPDDRRLSVLSVRDRSCPPPLPAVRCELTPFLPSQKAPPPSPIAADRTPEPLAFPREELLKMN